MRSSLIRSMICASFYLTLLLAASAQDFTKLVDFNGADGRRPFDGLVQARDGNLYGTTAGGGNGDGNVFKMTPAGAVTSLYSFTGGKDGYSPRGGLVQATDGNFYGTTASSYPGGGTVFRITPSGTLTTLYTFCLELGCPDGSQPVAALVQANDGNFYATTEHGGGGTHCGVDGGCGTIFRVTPSGSFTLLHQFCTQSNCPDGALPQGSLIQATDGDLYGTTEGTVFKISLSGDLTTLHTFKGNPTEGALSEAGLVQASDGNFYGTTVEGGVRGFEGTVFKVTSQGVLTTIYTFCSLQSCTDGGSPQAPLIQGSDGYLYGTTPFYGTGCGTVFRITLAGALTTLHTFNNTDGCNSDAPLVQASDGTYYGTAWGGGSSQQCQSCGTVFTLSFPPVALSITTSGSGVVSSADGHIYCGDVCSFVYTEGAGVTLSAVPAPGYTFSGWTGCDHVNGSYCSVTMTSAKKITATFTTANITLTSLTFKPNYVKGGQLSAGTLTLNAAAPPGGVTVALSSDHPGVAHPPSFVLVPGGKTSAQFAVNTFPVKSNTTVTITATAGASHVSGTLTVGTIALPPSLK